MTIKSGLELYEPKVRVDLLGPDGNVFVLIKTAMVWGRKRGMSQSDVDALRDEMMSDTYDHAIKVFDREFGDMCDLYLPKSSAEQKIVEKTTKVVVKERVEREARRFREAICLNNFGYEDCFEVGLSYRVTRRGNKAMKVEDMMGEVQEVLIERFGEVTEVINEDVEPYNVESDLESLNYCLYQVPINEDAVIVILNVMKKKMDINEWYARITGELTKEEYQTLQDVIMNQLEVD